MGQEFRQALPHELLTPHGVQGSPGSRQLAAGLLWKVQTASVTCLHLVGMTGRLGSARCLIHSIRLPGLHVAHSAEWSDFLPGGSGLSERKELEATNLQVLDPNWALHRICHILMVRASLDSKRRTVSKNLRLILSTVPTTL